MTDKPTVVPDPIDRTQILEEMNRKLREQESKIPKPDPSIVIEIARRQLPNRQ